MKEDIVGETVYILISMHRPRTDSTIRIGKLYHAGTKFDKIQQEIVDELDSFDDEWNMLRAGTVDRETFESILD